MPLTVSPPRRPPHHRASHHATAPPRHRAGQPGSSLRQMSAVESTRPIALWCTRRHWETSQAAGRAREVTKGRPTILLGPLSCPGWVARSMARGAGRGQLPAGLSVQARGAAGPPRVRPESPALCIQLATRSIQARGAGARLRTVSKGLLCAPSRRQGVSPCSRLQLVRLLGRMDVRTLMLSPWWAVKSTDALAVNYSFILPYFPRRCRVVCAPAVGVVVILSCESPAPIMYHRGRPQRPAHTRGGRTQDSQHAGPGR